jgi:asparagine synthase (glutamine-hydrolysing)
VYAQWCVMRLARAHGVTVLLDGQGGDELFAGYHTYFGTYFASLLRRGRLIQLRRELAAYERRHGRSGLPLLRAALGSTLPPALRRALRSLVPRQPPAWLGAQLRDYSHVWPDPGSPFRDPFDRQLHEFLTAQNLPALLHYEDRSSMAFSIEARVPFLDEELVEFVFALPAEYKLRDGETKWVLRQALRGLLPEAVRTRQDKLGFATPGGDWLRGPLRPLVDEVFAAPCFRQRGYFEVAVLDEIWRRHKAGQADLHTLIWRALNLELWSQRFIDRRPEPP